VIFSKEQKELYYGSFHASGSFVLKLIICISSLKCLFSENVHVELFIPENGLNCFRTGSYGRLYMYHELQEILK
jgi:hypothetical protein